MNSLDEVFEAVRLGDTHTVLRFLDEGGDVNAVNGARGPDGMTLLLASVRCSKVELCRVLLARGADPNTTLLDLNNAPHKVTNLLWVAAYIADGGVVQLAGVIRPPQGGGAAWSASPSGKIYQILVESGADVNVLMRSPYASYRFSHQGFKGSLLAILLIYFGRRLSDDRSVVLEIVTTLLRAGARLDSIVEDQASGEIYSASWCLDQALADRELEYDEHFIKTGELIVGVQEDGSFKRFMRRPHREVLRLRSLVSRGHATPKKWSPRGHDWHAIQFLVNPDVPNEVCWNILSFWRASE